MRALLLIPVVALAACSGENKGWNPNYRAEATPYGNYLRAREAALTGKQAPPRVIPVARPFNGPTAAEIAGPSPVQILERETTVAAARSGVTTDRTLGALDRKGAPAVDTAPPVHYRITRPAPGAATVVAPATVVAAPLAGRWPRDGSVRGNCAAWPSPEAAQQAFAAQGGPQRDPLGLDPDGDGRVCGWTPDRGELL